jgi:hypothetical protein
MSIRNLLALKAGPVVGAVRPLANRYSYFFLRQRNLERWAVRRGAFTITSQPDPGALGAAAELLVSHHDGLRLRAAGNRSAWTETIGDATMTSPLVALYQRNRQDADAYLNDQVEELNDFCFPGDLFKIVYLNTHTRHLIFFLFHHLVADAISMNIVVSDFFHTYRALLARSPIDLPAKTTSFLGFCDASFRFWNQRAAEEGAYWRSVGFERRHSLRKIEELEGTANIEENSVAVATPLPLDERSLRNLHGQTGWGAAELILAAIARGYFEWTKGGILHLGLVMHGRESFLAQADLSRTVGWISETVPLLFDGCLPRGELLAECRRQLRQASWRGKSYGVLRYLAPDPQDLDRLPSPQISLNLKLSRAQAISADGLHVMEPEYALKDCEIGSTQRAFLLSGGVFADPKGHMCLSWDFSRKLFDAADIAEFTWLCAANLDRIMRSESGSEGE